VAGASDWVSGPTMGQETVGWLGQSVLLGKLIPWQCQKAQSCARHGQGGLLALEASEPEFAANPVSEMRLAPRGTWLDRVEAAYSH
jgi:hypothetical protein